MSKKVKCNIFEMVVPENICLYTKTTDLLDAVLRYEKICLRRPYSKMVVDAFNGEI